MTHLKPNHEDLVQEALRSGRYRNVDEFLDEALSAWKKQSDSHDHQEPQSDGATARKKKRLSELFAPLRGLDIDLSRNPSAARPVKL